MLLSSNVSGDPPTEESWGNHVVVVVRIDDDLWVADVGLGDGPMLPFRLPIASPKGTKLTWEERGWRYAVEERPHGLLWRFTHHPGVGSFPGFELDLSGRQNSPPKGPAAEYWPMAEALAVEANCVAEAGCESEPERLSMMAPLFVSHHLRYWLDPTSPYVRSGVVLLKRTKDGVLKLRGFRLWFINPGQIERAHAIQSEARTAATTNAVDQQLLREATDREDWLQLVAETFGLHLRDLLSAYELDVLWERVSADNRCFKSDDAIY